MKKKFSRKPVANFFLKKDLQIRLIKKIVFAVLISTIVCVATLFLMYYAKYRNAVFYQVTFDMGADIGDRLKIFSLIFPSLLIASLVNIIIAFFIGLYASRKYAVPIFKLEQWSHLLREGKITAQLRFREKEEMRELSSTCNQVSNMLQRKLEEIEKCTDELKEDPSKPEPIDKIRTILDSLEFKTETIEVHTSFIHTDQLPKDIK